MQERHSVEITEIYSHNFWQKFREINVFTKQILKSWFHEKKIFSVREFFVFPHCERMQLGGPPMMWIFDNFDSFFETFNVFWERIVKNKEILIDIRYLYNSRTAHIIKFDEEIVHYLRSIICRNSFLWRF